MLPLDAFGLTLSPSLLGRQDLSAVWNFPLILPCTSLAHASELNPASQRQPGRPAACWSHPWPTRYATVSQGQCTYSRAQCCLRWVTQGPDWERGAVEISMVATHSGHILQTAKADLYPSTSRLNWRGECGIISNHPYNPSDRDQSQALLSRSPDS